MPVHYNDGLDLAYLLDIGHGSNTDGSSRSPFRSAVQHVQHMFVSDK